MKKMVTEILTKSGQFAKASFNLKNRTERTAARSARGFTLIEIMIVIVIIGMLGTGVTIGLVSRLDDARQKTAHQESCTIRSAVILFMAQNSGQCPSMDDLTGGGYLDTKMRTVDPWNQEYNVDCEEGDPDVYSLGKDGSGRIGCDSGETEK